MKRFSALLLICLTIDLTTVSGQETAPSMVIDDPVKNFGKVLQGEVLKHVFSFSNKGSSVLEILRVEASCGCQTTSLSAKQIQPGQSGQIEVAVDTAGIVGPTDKSVHIITNDPRHPSVSLSIRAEIQPEIIVSSPSIYFESVPKGTEEVRKEITITIPAERSIRILSAESTEKSVTVKLEPVPDSNGKQVRLIATQRPGGKTGYHMERIIVKTSSYLTPELSIYLLIRNFNR